MIFHLNSKDNKSNRQSCGSLKSFYSDHGYADESSREVDEDFGWQRRLLRDEQEGRELRDSEVPQDAASLSLRRGDGGRTGDDIDRSQRHGTDQRHVNRNRRIDFANVLRPWRWWKLRRREFFGRRKWISKMA